MTLFIKPVNKTLLVQRDPVPETKNEFGIIMPLSTSKIENTTIVTLIAASDDSQYKKYEDSRLLVRAAMLEDIEIKGTKSTFLSENGIIGIISESD